MYRQNCQKPLECNLQSIKKLQNLSPKNLKSPFLNLRLKSSGRLSKRIERAKTHSSPSKSLSKKLKNSPDKCDKQIMISTIMIGLQNIQLKEISRRSNTNTKTALPSLWLEKMQVDVSRKYFMCQH